MTTINIVVVMIIIIIIVLIDYIDASLNQRLTNASAGATGGRKYVKSSSVTHERITHRTRCKYSKRFVYHGTCIGPHIQTTSKKTNIMKAKA